jgi:hypothetical protein
VRRVEKEILKGTEHMLDLDVDGRILLKWMMRNKL